MRKAGELAAQEQGRSKKASGERRLILADLIGNRAWQRAADLGEAGGARADRDRAAGNVGDTPWLSKATRSGRRRAQTVCIPTRLPSENGSLVRLSRRP